MTEVRRPGPELQASESPQTYVAEILRREAEVGETAPPFAARPRRPVLVMLIGFMLAVTVWNVVVNTRPPQVFTPAQVEASTRFRIYLLAQDIEAYRDSTGRLPVGLDVLGQGQDGVTYVTEGSAYYLTAFVGTERIRYRSGDDLAPFASAYELLLPGGREP